MSRDEHFRRTWPGRVLSSAAVVVTVVVSTVTVLTIVLVSAAAGGAGSAVLSGLNAVGPAGGAIAEADSPGAESPGAETETTEPLWVITDPYGELDWAAYGQYKANLHTHTTTSDGTMNPHVVVDTYQALGYAVLAITDHDEVTYPWTAFSEMRASSLSSRRMFTVAHRMPKSLEFEDRDPDRMGMVAIQGNELSMHHHMGSYFSDYRGTADLEASLAATAANGGLAMLFHPGRYNRPVEWYVELYRRYDHLFGLEVYNQGDRYPGDRRLWDAILDRTMPERPVWGYSNDDAHDLSHIGLNWNTLILPELSVEAVRRAMERGHSYFVYAPLGPGGPAPPVLEAVTVDDRNATLEVTARGHTQVDWVSSGAVVASGERVALDELEGLGAYIRAELRGAGGTVVGTQPFGLLPSGPAAASLPR